jgi:hypothetical protein
MGTAWSVQLVALPRPTHADLVAARAARWLNDYRTAVDVFRVGGRRIEGLCLHGSPTDRHGERSRSSVLVLVSGKTFHVTQTRTEERVVDEAGRQDRPGLLAANVGCTYQLLAEIGEAVRTNVAIDATPATVARQPAIALRLSRVRRERLTLYVAPSTYRPLFASARIGGRQITARLHLMPLDQQLLAQFGLNSRRP